MSNLAIPSTPAAFKGKKVVLIGLGTRTHVSLARFLVANGAVVTISDAKPAEKLELEIGLLGDLPVRLSLGGHFETDILDADMIFVTPGAGRDLPVLKKAAAMGLPISSEIELLFRFCSAPIIAVTGSSGKTTTTTLVGEVLKAAGRRTFVGGNLGIPLIDRLDDIRPDAWVVLELSSFQLEYMTQSPHIGAILNITPNHLDRHGTMANYAAAKKNIVLHQRPDDWAILGADDPLASSMETACAGHIAFFSAKHAVDVGAFLNGEQVRLRFDGHERMICKTKDVKLPGQHNLWNILAASTIAAAAGIDLEPIRDVMTSFAGVEHRLELVREMDGRKYFNDAIATSPERTLAAVRSFQQPMVLLAGGKSKHLAMEELAQEIVSRVRHLIVMGEFGQELVAAIQAIPGGNRLPITEANSLEDAVRKATDKSLPGDAIVLSPGGTSFDWFRDFEDRGKQFKSLVMRL